MRAHALAPRCTCAEKLLQVGVELLRGGRLQFQRGRFQADLGHARVILTGPFNQTRRDEYPSDSRQVAALPYRSHSRDEQHARTDEADSRY